MFKQFYDVSLFEGVLAFRVRLTDKESHHQHTDSRVTTPPSANDLYW